MERPHFSLAAAASTPGCVRFTQQPVFLTNLSTTTWVSAAYMRFCVAAYTRICYAVYTRICVAAYTRIVCCSACGADIFVISEKFLTSNAIALCFAAYVESNYFTF